MTEDEQINFMIELLKEIKELNGRLRDLNKLGLNQSEIACAEAME